MLKQWVIEDRNGEHLVMGGNPDHYLRLSDVLAVMSNGRKKFQELYLETLSKNYYNKIVKELEKVDGSKEWVTSAMRVWRGPNNRDAPAVFLKDMTGDSDMVHKGFGTMKSRSMSGDGFSKKLIDHINEEFDIYNLELVRHFTVAIDVYDISMTRPSLRPALGALLCRAQRLEFYTNDVYPPDYVNFGNLVVFFRDFLDLKKCYLSVDLRFQRALLDDLATTVETTVGTRSPKTTQSGDNTPDDILPTEPSADGRALDTCDRLILVVTIVVGLL